MVHPLNPYLTTISQELDSYEQDLWFHLERVPLLPHEDALCVLRVLLERACESQHVANILIGRAGILALPRAWVLQHIEGVAVPLLQSDDDWEYLRLVEVYWSLDKALAEKLARRALQSPNAAVREVGHDCLEKLSDPASEHIVNYWEL